MSKFFAKNGFFGSVCAGTREENENALLFGACGVFGSESAARVFGSMDLRRCDRISIRSDNI